MLPTLPRRTRSRALPLITATALLAAVGVAAPALAATPTSGTVSDTSTSVQWGAGPFVAPNVTGATGGVTCGPDLCDDFALHVATPAGYGDTHQLTIKVGWPNAAADFDVYLLDPSGAVVASSASSADPEVIVTAPTSGDYTVRVVPYAPLGESVTGTATLTDVPGEPRSEHRRRRPPSASTAHPRRSPDAHDAGEPSIGSSHPTGSTFYQALYDTYKATWDDSVTPSKVTWSDVSAKPANGCATGGSTSPGPDRVHRPPAPVASSRASSPARPRSCATPTTRARRGRPARAAASTPASTTRPSAAAATRPTASARCPRRPTRTPSTTAARTSPTPTARRATTAA